MKKILYLLQLIPALILLQTLFFKFSGATESIWIFNKLGAEPWGRWLSGLMELLAAGLLLYSPTKLYGALLTVMIMTGAIMSHFFVLGIDVQGDGGTLFALALFAKLFSLIIMWNERKQLIKLITPTRTY